MSYLKLINNQTLFHILFKIDEEFSEQCRLSRCQKSGCGGPLHKAYYSRKPRGETCHIPEAYRIRLGLCCGWCRRRTLPPSCLFWGRCVYWGIIVILITSILQGLTESTPIKTMTLCVGVSYRTLYRWNQFFTQDFVHTKQWQCLRGFVSADVSNAKLPCSLLESFLSENEQHIDAAQRCLQFLANGCCGGRYFK